MRKWIFHAKYAKCFAKIAKIIIMMGQLGGLKWKEKSKKWKEKRKMRKWIFHAKYAKCFAKIAKIIIMMGLMGLLGRWIVVLKTTIYGFVVTITNNIRLRMT